MSPPSGWSTLADLLRRPLNDQMVVDFLGPAIDDVNRSGAFSCVEFKADGLEVVLGNAARVVPASEIADPLELRLIAFHLHRGGHEGYSAYRGALPGGVTLDDPEWTVLRKLGAPASSGGGGTRSEQPGEWIPYWIKYQVGSNALRFQSDREGCVEMATLMAPDARLASAPPQHRMIIVSMPSRVSLLWRREQSKGSSLTEQEVAEICNESAAVALPLMAAAAVEDARGYRDIVGDNCWAEWQQARLELFEHARSAT
jgi:hypothetical protein